MGQQDAEQPSSETDSARPKKARLVFAGVILALLFIFFAFMAIADVKVPPQKQMALTWVSGWFCYLLWRYQGRKGWVGAFAGFAFGLVGLFIVAFMGGYARGLNLRAQRAINATNPPQAIAQQAAVKEGAEPTAAETYTQDQIASTKRAYGYLKAVAWYLQKCESAAPARLQDIDTLQLVIRRELSKIEGVATSSRMPNDERRKFADHVFDRKVEEKLSHDNPNGVQAALCRGMVTRLMQDGFDQKLLSGVPYDKGDVPN